MLHRFLFRLYFNIYRYDNWLRRHFSMSGHFLLMLMIAAAVFGIDTYASTTYQLFVLLAVLIAFSLFGSLFNRLNVSVERHLPNYLTVGEPVTYRLTISNKTDNNYSNLAVIELLAEKPPDFSKISKTSRYKKKHLITFQQWRRYLIFQRGGFIPEVGLAPLTKHPIQCKVSFTPLRRGELHFSGCYIAKADLLGIFRRLLFVEKKQRCLVLPKRYPIRQLATPGKRKYQPGGFTLANSVGESAEFMSLRNYRHGDPLHAVHWKSLAKHGELVTREYQDEYFVRRALLLDTFQKNANENQFEAAVCIAASVTISERHNDALLDLIFAGPEIYCFTSGRGIDHLPHVQEILASVRPCRNGSFNRLRQTVLQNTNQCSSLICVLLHWDQERRDFIEQLRRVGLAVTIFLVYDGTANQKPVLKPSATVHLIDSRHIAESLAAI